MSRRVAKGARRYFGWFRYLALGGAVDRSPSLSDQFPAPGSLASGKRHRYVLDVQAERSSSALQDHTMRIDGGQYDIVPFVVHGRTITPGGVRSVGFKVISDHDASTNNQLRIQMAGKTDTVANREMFRMTTQWSDIADATRTSRVLWGAATNGTFATFMAIQGGNIHFGGSNPGAMTAKITQATLGAEVTRIESTATNDDPSLRTFQGRVATTNATPATALTLDLAALTDLSSTTDLAATCIFIVTARRTGGTSGAAGDSAGYIINAIVKLVGGTASVVGSLPVPVGEDQAGWDATVDATGSTIRVRVTGAANNNVTWHVSAQVCPVAT